MHALFFFSHVPSQSFTPLFGILNQFPSEKVLVSREMLGGSYLASSYYLSRVMAELPFAFFSTGE